MAYVDIFSAVHGAVPKLPWDHARQLAADAWSEIQRKSLWSFQLFESNWTSPAMINTGTASVTQTSNMVTLNAAASAAVAAVISGGQFFSSLINQRQFRVGIGTIYNIWQYDQTVPTAIVLTLDRPYQEATAAATKFTIYQCYFPSPYKDFVRWVTIRDIINFNDLVTTKTRAELDFRDPQRSVYYIPTHVVPYQIDQNPVSLTNGFMLHEMWSQPTTQLTYQLYGLRNGNPLVNDSDTLPPAVGEDCVRALAKKYAYEWAMANQGDQPRGQGVDYKFLMASTMADYDRLYKDYRKRDREVVDNWRVKLRRGGYPVSPSYSSIAQRSSPGAAW